MTRPDSEEPSQALRRAVQLAELERKERDALEAQLPEEYSRPGE
jgi:hypothetical protein